MAPDAKHQDFPIEEFDIHEEINVERQSSERCNRNSIQLCLHEMFFNKQKESDCNFSDSMTSQHLIWLKIIALIGNWLNMRSIR